MNKERERYQKIISTDDACNYWNLTVAALKDYDHVYVNGVRYVEYQPNINTQYLLDQVARLTAENAMLKEKWLAQPEPLTPREDLREEITLRDATNDGLRKEIASLRTANDRQEADLRLAKTALAETMKLFNNQPNDSGLRDHFAGLAMQGFLAADYNDWDYEKLALTSYEQADAMLAERSKRDE